ncbi:MAG: hypothetical protein L3J33_07605 [Rhodobacteraceae bacterium]|nr:hypothetical protein [Paracoccaceae bacterium]
MAKEIIREVQRRFGPDVQVEFLYTTRATEPWIKSVYGHLSRSIRIREDHAEFCGLFDTVPNLDHEAGKIAEAIAPVPVHTAALEHFGPKRLGMAQAIFELLDIPDEALAKLPKAKRTNVGQSEEITAKFCGLNNEIKNARALKQKKADILAGL